MGNAITSNDYEIGGDNKHGVDNKHIKYPRHIERKPSPMLNIMRERRAANILNENYVTDAQHNGKLMSNFVEKQS